MKSIWTHCILAVLILATVWFFASDSLNITHWSGQTNLTIRVLAVDQSTGLLIPNATIEIRSEDDYLLPATSQRSPSDHLYHAELAGDTSGSTTIYHQKTMTSGTIRPITFTDTYAVMMPGWIINVTAPGYRRSEDCFIQAITHSKFVRRTSRGESELQLQVSLNRAE